MAVSSVRDLLPLIEKSGLLTPDQLAEVRTWPEQEPKTLAARMVTAGWITKWQSQQLLAGRSQPFFLGKYKLLELIGQGGMGSVYKAVRPGIGRTVALKVMSRQLLKQPKSVTRFLREIRSAAAVDHPNLVRAFDADCEGDTYFLVMEYVTGRNLKSWIMQEQTLPVGWSCECIRQAAVGLQHAFEQGMVHRDIKPSNLLVAQEGKDGLPLVKVLDLGLARFVSETQDDGEITRSGQVLGTPDYIAPEQARNTRTADIRADIFSLGCALFEMLTGRLPFPGDSVMEKLMARATQDAPPVRLYRPDVPPELDAVVARMLARDPQHRFAAPADVARALSHFAIGSAGARVTEPPADGQQYILSDGSTPVTFRSSDVTNDGTFSGFPDDLTRVTTEPLSRPVAPVGGIWRHLQFRITAGVVAAVAVLGFAVSLIPGKKRQSDDAVTRTEHPADNQQKKSLQKQREKPLARSDGDEDPERATAVWVLEKGGSLIVVRGPWEGTPDGKDGSSKTHPLGSERIEVHDASELPATTGHLMGVAFHGAIQLRKADFERLSDLPRLESLSLAETRFSDGDLSGLRNARRLTRLDLQSTSLTDAGITPLKNLRSLQVLKLSRTRISGTSLEKLQPLKGLIDLDLEGTEVGDVDLKDHIAGLPQLQHLNLARTRVRGGGLPFVWRLADLTSLDLSGLHLGPNALNLPRGTGANLQRLILTGAKVTDDGLKRLSGMTSLRVLSLGSTQVTGDGLKHLTWMPELARLDLENTVVGDDGVKSLAGLSSLKALNLRGTAVSDAGIEHLTTMTGLESVDLTGSKVTSKGIDALQNALPRCKIEY